MLAPPPVAPPYLPMQPAMPQPQQQQPLSLSMSQRALLTQQALQSHMHTQHLAFADPAATTALSFPPLPPAPAPSLPLVPASSAPSASELASRLEGSLAQWRSRNPAVAEQVLRAPLSPRVARAVAMHASGGAAAASSPPLFLGGARRPATANQQQQEGQLRLPAEFVAMMQARRAAQSQRQRQGQAQGGGADEQKSAEFSSPPASARIYSASPQYSRSLPPSREPNDVAATATSSAQDATAMLMQLLRQAPSSQPPPFSPAFAHAPSSPPLTARAQTACSPTRSSRRAQTANAGASSPIRSSSPHSLTARLVPSHTPDLAYLHLKRRGVERLERLKGAAGKARSSAVQLEMRGSVRFNVENPRAIFSALEAEASKPLPETVEWNEKHVVTRADGTSVTVFGNIHARSDTVRDSALSEFFIHKKSGPAVTLEKFIAANFARDQAWVRRQQERSERHNRSGVNYSRRLDRSDSDLLQTSDDVLTPLERWKKAQVAQRRAKEAAAEEEGRMERARLQEALRARLERERFEREEREKSEREAAARLAAEEEERARVEAERQRAYRSLTAAQAEEIKAAKLAAKRAEEEAKRAEEENRRRRAQALHAASALAGGDTPTYMRPLVGKSLAAQQRSAEEEALVSRVRDAEKDLSLARAKLKAEVARMDDLLRKRAQARTPTPAASSAASSAALAAPIGQSGIVGLRSPRDAELKESIRRLRASNVLALEENKLRELERVEEECRLAHDKAMGALESYSDSQRSAESERERRRATRRTMAATAAAAGAGGFLSPHSSGAASSVGSGAVTPAGAGALSASPSDRNVRAEGGGIEEEYEYASGNAGSGAEDGDGFASDPSRAVSPSRTAAAANDSDAVDGGGEGPIVSDRMLEIDATRQALVMQQADFEARIKALTSFGDKKKSGMVGKKASSPQRRTAGKA